MLALGRHAVEHGLGGRRQPLAKSVEGVGLREVQKVKVRPPTPHIADEMMPRLKASRIRLPRIGGQINSAVRGVGVGVLGRHFSRRYGRCGERFACKRSRRGRERCHLLTVVSTGTSAKAEPLKILIPW